ncbi:hypothetical protein LX64_00311 [Chitinophaga skermanii]|uniref:Uncharacterized protein n=1 Tax=Chitinophaga skermanii TaxID=331697 RepID=A0A327R3B2_9BACT|nr:hypothetical protein LX64_00311 [Chitinophaga skermanii]
MLILSIILLFSLWLGYFIHLPIRRALLLKRSKWNEELGFTIGFAIALCLGMMGLGAYLLMIGESFTTLCKELPGVLLYILFTTLFGSALFYWINRYEVKYLQAFIVPGVIAILVSMVVMFLYWMTQIPC